MFLIECFGKENNICSKTFHIEGTNKDIVIRRAKDKLGLRGVKCRVKIDNEITTLIPNNIKTIIKIKEV